MFINKDMEGACCIFFCLFENLSRFKSTPNGSLLFWKKICINNRMSNHLTEFLNKRIRDTDGKKKIKSLICKIETVVVQVIAVNSFDTGFLPLISTRSYLACGRCWKLGPRSIRCRWLSCIVASRTNSGRRIWCNSFSNRLIRVISTFL